MSLQRTQISLRLSGVETKTVAGQSLSFTLSETYANTFTDGTGANQAQVIVPFEADGETYDGCTTSYSYDTSTDIDLTSIAGVYGTVTLTSIKALVLTNTMTSGSDYIVFGNGGGGTDGWVGPFGAVGNTINVYAGCSLLFVSPLAAGWAVDGTHKYLRMRASADTLTYELWLIGLGTYA
jgi:hypothetical protein